MRQTKQPKQKNKYRMKNIISLILCIATALNALAQINDNRPTQTIRGIVTDRASGSPVPFASVGLTDSPETGTVTDESGKFVLNNIAIGRHTVQATSVGYEPSIFKELLLTSAKEIYLEIAMKENVRKLDEVIVSVQTNKNEPLNKMSLTGARMLSVEEASRYAGSMDDPARLVSSFAGVSPGVGNNGISVHGNAPSLLQWKLEDVEIPNPNHFADVATLGGGILSSLSSNVLGNSDFFTGAFSAEYNNAVSGVFDMKLRNGNNHKYQHTFQAGLLGLDFASEGPISRKNNSSYIFNYRYSTTGLMNKVSPAGDLEQVLDYQDLNFKINFPTKKAGIFSLWGTALKDNIKPEMESPDEWEYKDDAKDSRMKQTSAALGLSHQYFFNNTTFLKTTLAATYSKTKTREDIYDTEMLSTPYLNFNSKYTNMVLTSYLNKKYGNKHTNKTGFTVTNMKYDMNFKLAPFESMPLQTISEGKGNTNLISAYTSSLVNFNDNISAVFGINGQLLTLNNNWTIEPRASVKWQFSSKSSLGLAYGLHSRMEKPDVYFVKTMNSGGKPVNKELDFTKTHHLSLSYNYKISDDMNVKIEPYFQYLFDVPVIADSSYSVLNRNIFYVENALVNKGRGRNYGVDITLEKYMTKGMYYMITASVFNSEYWGGDGIRHNTGYNRNYIINGLFGKEWTIGRSNRNVLGINFKLTLQGGDRYSPVDEQASLAHPDKETQYDETRAFSKQLPPMFLANYTISYRMNRKKVSHEIAIKSMNATGYKEYFGHEYNLKTETFEAKRIKNSIFNVVYRLDF